MSDSEEVKPQELPKVSEEIIVHPPAVKQEIVISRTGKPTVRLRGEGGKFQKKPRTKPKSEEIVRYMRELLNKAEAGPDGRLRRGDKTRFRRMFDNIFEIASMAPESPVFDKKGEPVYLVEPKFDEKGNIIEKGTLLMVKDAKMAMASTQAFKELMLRSYGMPSKSDEELDALKEQGVKIVVINPPDQMVNKEVVEEKAKEELVPSFIDAEIIENK